jgi:hypothetical protein
MAGNGVGTVVVSARAVLVFEIVESGLVSVAEDAIRPSWEWTLSFVSRNQSGGLSQHFAISPTVLSIVDAAV